MKKLFFAALLGILLFPASASSAPRITVHPMADPGVHITAVVSNKKETYIGSREGLFIVNRKSGTVSKLTTDNSILPSNVITAACCLKNGEVFIGTNLGILRFDKFSSLIVNHENSKLPDDHITALAEDADGNLWIGTYFGGISIYKNGRYTNLNQSNSALGNNCIYSISTDRDGTVWVAPFLQGLIRIKDNNWTFLHKDVKGKEFVNVSFVSQTADGSHIIGTYHGEVYSIRDNNVTEIDGIKETAVRFRYLNTCDDLQLTVIGLENELLLAGPGIDPFQISNVKPKVELSQVPFPVSPMEFSRKFQ